MAFMICCVSFMPSFLSLSFSSFAPAPTPSSMIFFLAFDACVLVSDYVLNMIKMHIYTHYTHFHIHSVFFFQISFSLNDILEVI